MERALFVDLLRDFAEFRDYCGRVTAFRAGGHDADGAEPRFTRIYAGAEFCVNRLPSPPMLAAAAGMCADAGLSFTLVLPPVYDTSFTRVDRAVAVMRPGTEVVINDWAELAPVMDAGCVPIMGRALNRLMRDPRLDPATRKAEHVEYLQMSQAHVPMVREFVAGRGIARVELDNVRQGLAPMPDHRMHASLYTPWTLVSVSRFCGDSYAAACPGRPCFQTRTFVEGIPIIADGTCTFWFNAGMPDDLDAIGIDRLVHVTGPEGLSWLRDELTHPAWDDVEMPRLRARRDVVVNDPVERIVLQALEGEFSDVCQIGCGFGAHLEVLDRMGKRLTGVDRSVTALDVARRRVPDARLVCGNASGLGTTGAFDLVIDLSFMADETDRRAGGAAIVKALRDGGLYLTSVDHDQSGPLKDLFEKSLSFVWQNEGADGKSLTLLRRAAPDHAAERRLADLIDAFLNKGFDSHDIDFVDLTAYVGRTPGAEAGPSFIPMDARQKLADLGFKYLWRELEGEGRTMFRLAHADFRIELEFSPVAQNRPSYRNCGTHNVAYHGQIDDMALLDAAIDVLATLI